MPLYEYECKPNGHRFEVRHGMTENPVHACPECGGEVRRVINPVGIVFKGSGFYATDSRKSSSGTGGGKAAATSGDTASSEAKTGDGESKTSEKGGDAKQTGDAKAAS